MMKRLAVLLILAGAPSVLVAPAGARPVGCGDTITGSVWLAADLSCPGGHGLVLANGAALDCAGHRITGGDQSSQYGIYLHNADDALVENCVVEHFQVGICLRASANAVVQDSVSRNNTNYGMEITQSSTGALRGRLSVRRTTTSRPSPRRRTISSRTSRRRPRSCARSTRPRA